MNKTIHIKLLLLFSLSILFGHSALAQISPTPPVSHYICVSTDVTYHSYGSPGSSIEWFLDSKSIGVTDLNDNENNITFDEGLFQKGNFPYVYATKGDYVLSIVESALGCPSNEITIPVHVYAKPIVKSVVASQIAACSGDKSTLTVNMQTTLPDALKLQYQLKLGTTVVKAFQDSNVFKSLADADKTYTVEVQYVVASDVTIVVDGSLIAKNVVVSEDADDIDPTITAPVEVAVNSDLGNCTASSVALGTPTTADNCGVASTTNDAPATFPLGETTVTWTVTDNSGRTATATQKVTVTDNEDPTITAPANVAVNSDSGSCEASSVALGTPTTADNCGVASTTNDAPSVFPLGETTVTWKVTDNSGLTATATQKVTVTDSEDPTITAPADVAVNSDLGNCTASLVALGTPTTNDNCGVASTTNDAPATFPLGETTVIWTVTDNSGLTATATQKVTVTDNEDPTITAPANVAVNSDLGNCTASSVALGTPTTADNCGVASTTNDAPSVFPLGETTVTWKVTDNSGLTATATQKVTVTDSEDPTITAPADVAVNSDLGNCTASLVALGTPTTNDNCGVASTTNDAPATFPLGETTVIWTVTDNSGLTATATQKVTVTDSEDPTITAPVEVAVNSDLGNCTASSVALGVPTTDDNCGVASTTNDAPAAFPLGETTVTWTVTDNSGLTATATQKVTVTDSEDPTITAPVEVAVNSDLGNCTASSVALGVPTTDDNCGVASTTNDAPAAFPLGETTVTWTVTDNSGLTATATQKVTVTDSEDPTITAPVEVAVNSDLGNCTASSVALGVPTTDDNCGVASTTNDAPAIFPLGETTVTWTVTDNSGLTATATQKVTVTDSEDPTITAPADVAVNSDLGNCTASSVALGTPVTDDNCGVASTTNDAPSVFPLGETTVTWTVTDNSGRTATATQKVTVTDNEDPTITAPSDVTANSDSGSCEASSVALGTPTTADNCGVASTTNDAPSVFPLGETTVTWTVTDNSGRTATATQKVTVTDNEDPVITDMPSDIYITNCKQVVNWDEPKVTDNCGNPSLSSNYSPGTVFPVGETTVTYIANDGTNTVSKSFKVTVEDGGEAPLICFKSTNYALNKTATQSSDYAGTGGGASSAVDGNTNGVFTDGSVTHTTGTGENQPWWEVQLVKDTKESYEVSYINIYNRTGSLGSRLNNFYVMLSENPFQSDDLNTLLLRSDVVSYFFSGIADEKTSLLINNINARYVRIQLSGDDGRLSLAEVEVMGCTSQTRDDINVSADAGKCTANVTWIEPTSVDNCGVVSLSSNYSSGEEFPVGTTTVTYTSTDGTNEETSSFDVTVTKENNLSVVDVTGTSDPKTDAGITSGGTHCPDLNGLQAVVEPSTYIYSPGTSQVQFRVDRLCDVSGDWSFAYEITGATVATSGVKLDTDSGSATDNAGLISVPATASYVLFTIDVENIVNTVLPIDFTISSGGTNSATQKDLTIQHNLKVIPLIGGFK